MTSLSAAVPLRRARVAAMAEAMRPRQWTKNLLVFAALVFAAKADHADLWLRAFAGFVAFCAFSSAAYLVNDAHDAPHDRVHPVKRFRPVARGAVSARGAVVIAAVLSAIALAVGVALGPRFFVLLLAFGTLQLSYTFVFKRIPFVDVLAIAAAFALRAVAGAAAVHVRTSPWLPICAVLLASFLGFAKRRGELVLATSARAPARSTLRAYSVSFLDSALWLTGAATIAVYGAYTLVARDQKELVATVPFVVFGIARYLQLVHRDDLGEEPEHVLLHDPPILITVVAWAVVATWILTAP